METIFSCYLKMVQLPDELKRRNKIKVGAVVPRFDVVQITGYFPQLESIKNNKQGMVCLLLQETIKTGNQSGAERWLQGKNSFNFSAIHLLDDRMADGSLVGFGNPNREKTFSQRRLQNPFYDCRNDGFLFLIGADWQTIEILVIPNGLYTIQGNAKELVDGKYREALEQVRNNAKPFFIY